MKTITILFFALSALSLMAAVLELRRDSRVVTNPTLIARLDRAAAGLTTWDHGYQTNNVRATRYSNPDIGQNVGFAFPGHENDCDRKEIVDFMTEHGGSVYQCGGFPGAEMFVVFKGVRDRETANAKLIEILPGLDRLIQKL